MFRCMYVNSSHVLRKVDVERMQYMVKSLLDFSPEIAVGHQVCTCMREMINFADAYIANQNHAMNSRLDCSTLHGYNSMHITPHII